MKKDSGRERRNNTPPVSIGGNDVLVVNKQLIVDIRKVAPVGAAGHSGTQNRILVNSDSVGAHDLEIVHGTVSKGGGADEHSHDVESAIFVLAGRATVKLGDETHKVGPGNLVFIPAGMKHQVRSTGRARLQALVIYAKQKRT